MPAEARPGRNPAEAAGRPVRPAGGGAASSPPWTRACGSRRWRMRAPGAGRRVVARIEGRPAPYSRANARRLTSCSASLASPPPAGAAELVAGTGATVLDTRKTTPGHRVLEKYAVRVGGCAQSSGRTGRWHPDQGEPHSSSGRYHRGGRARARAARRRCNWSRSRSPAWTNWTRPSRQAPRWCWSTTPARTLRAAVARAAGRVRLEASGGITLDNLAEVARTGVDYISLGALTHSAGSLDFSLEII